jgi:hypothetical protein
MKKKRKSKTTLHYDEITKIISVDTDIHVTINSRFFVNKIKFILKQL